MANFMHGDALKAKPEGAKVPYNHFCQTVMQHQNPQNVFENFASFYPDNVYLTFDDSCIEGEDAFAVSGFQHLDYDGKAWDVYGMAREQIYQFSSGMKINFQDLQYVVAMLDCKKDDFECFVKQTSEQLPEANLFFIKDFDACEHNFKKANWNGGDTEYFGKFMVQSF